MDGTSLIVAGAAAAAGAVAALRASWARPKRSAPLNALGWGLIALAAALGWQGAGAWGASVVALVGMGAAAVALAAAAATAPAGKAAASNRRVKMLPEQGEPKQIARRVVTFLIAVPLALAVSLGLAVVVRALADLAGASEADSVTLAFFATPFVWAILAHVLLIQQRRRSQWMVLLASALPVVPVMLTGVLS
ncbi:MAG TPA: hypothetical protein VL100_03095 [Croceibacterium sp.]|nr:hypothetical protein [Croceibacterium sp.]